MRTNLQKNLRRPHGHAWLGTLFQRRCLEHTARHTIATRPKCSRRACERKGMLAFAPRLFKNLGLTKGWFPKGWFPKGWFPKGWFWWMFPRNENRNEGTFACSPGTETGTRVRSDVPPERKPERGYVRMFPLNENRDEGTLAKTTLFRNRPFISQ